MAKKELISFCKPEETPPFGGAIHFQNPRYFYPHESIPAYCTHFFAEDKVVREAYLAAGKIEHKAAQSPELEDVNPPVVEDKPEKPPVADTPKESVFGAKEDKPVVTPTKETPVKEPAKTAPKKKSVKKTK